MECRVAKGSADVDGRAQNVIEGNKARLGSTDGG